MRIFTTCAALLLTASLASAQDRLLLGGTLTSEDGNYELSASLPTPVGTLDDGDGLWATTLSITNISGNDALNINSVVDGSIGAASGLHQDFGGGGFAPTPTAATFAQFNGAAPSSVDSHWLPSGATPAPVITAPAEAGPLTGRGIDSELASVGGVAGMSATGLTGAFGFVGAESTEIAYLVAPQSFFEEGGVGVDFSFGFNDADIASPQASFSGSVLGVVPEPSTAILAGLALVGFVSRRK